MFKKLLLASVISAVAILPAAAQSTPAAGSSGGPAWLASLPSGTWAIVGGVLFFVAADGLTESSGGRSDPIGDAESSPAPTTTTASATTATTTTTN